MFHLGLNSNRNVLPPATFICTGNVNSRGFRGQIKRNILLIIDRTIEYSQLIMLHIAAERKLGIHFCRLSHAYMTKQTFSCIVASKDFKNGLNARRHLHSSHYLNVCCKVTLKLGYFFSVSFAFSGIQTSSAL